MNKMTKCKACGAEIAKSAKVCPQCGAKNKRHKALGVILVIIGLIIVIGAIGGGGDTTTDTTTDNAPIAYAVNEPAELNGVTVTLLNVSESRGSQFNKPTDGNVFLLCEFEIANNSDKDINVSSMASFEGYCDDYALTYSLTALIEKGNKNQLDGTVASGKKFNGVIGYEVPTDWNELEVKFTPDFWSGKDITFIAEH